MDPLHEVDDALSPDTSPARFSPNHPSPDRLSPGLGTTGAAGVTSGAGASMGAGAGATGGTGGAGVGADGSGGGGGGGGGGGFGGGAPLRGSVADLFECQTLNIHIGRVRT